MMAFILCDFFESHFHEFHLGEMEWSKAKWMTWVGATKLKLQVC